ncbi:uncharacterized protein LOC124666125 isoform X1 [Lolium rigidum]|uniref:uncharacterized protein LOC124666125 isoform X1 n=1 Tax=Lolium rigidum TaxID=89674 RepID=UPI001F5CFCA8|nr:uncharacterized protein LOC124666125 isoform X1 [Lolium rigidum]
MCSTPTPCASHRCRGDRSSVGLLGLSCAATTLNLRGVVSIVKSDVVPGNVDVAGRSGGRIGHAQIIPGFYRRSTKTEKCPKRVPLKLGILDSFFLKVTPCFYSQCFLNRVNVLYTDIWSS